MYTPLNYSKNAVVVEFCLEICSFSGVYWTLRYFINQNITFRDLCFVMRQKYSNIFCDTDMKVKYVIFFYKKLSDSFRIHRYVLLSAQFFKVGSRKTEIIAHLFSFVIFEKIYL